MTSKTALLSVLASVFALSATVYAEQEGDISIVFMTRECREAAIAKVKSQTLSPELYEFLALPGKDSDKLRVYTTRADKSELGYDLSEVEMTFDLSQGKCVALSAQGVGGVGN